MRFLSRFQSRHQQRSQIAFCAAEHGILRGGRPGLRAIQEAGRTLGSAFTLVELLVVMGVIVLLIASVAPVINAMKGAGDVNKAVYDIAGILTQARSYAMSSSTYVYVGFEEVDTTQSALATPQVAGTGRVGIAVVASKDGTSGYSVSAPSTSWTANYQSGKNFLIIGQLQTFDNLHLVNLGQRPTSGGLVRPPLTNTDAIDVKYNLGDASCVSVTPFTYPLGVAQNAGRYNFSKVIEFSPQGIARLQYDDNSDIIAPWLEIGLQQSRGNVVTTLTPPVSTGNVVAIQINGVTGGVRIYRP